MSDKKSFWDNISPFTLIMTLVILMVIGIALMPLIDVSSNPRQQQGKSLEINYFWSNTSAKIIEQNVTSHIEGVVSAVKGVESVQSFSYFGWGKVKVKLKKGVDVSAVKFEISSLLKQISKHLPEKCSYPSLSGGEVVNERRKRDNQKLLLTYRVNANMKDEQIHEYLELNVKKRIVSLEGVTGVYLTGGNSQYLEVCYDPLVLSNYGVNVNDIEEAIKNYVGKNNVVGDVIINENGTQQRITLQLSSKSFKKDIGEIPMKSIAGKIIYLNNLATYTYKEHKPNSYYRVNGLNSININIYVDADENVISMSEVLREKIDEIKSSLIEGVYLTLTFDIAKEKRSELEKLVTRTILSLIILLLFVWMVSRSVKYLSIITITLAANILIAVISYYIFNIRLHTIALAGITVSLGLIIDSSIVMVDHYSYYRDRKAFFSILAALLTTIGSLVLVFFMPEYIRRDLYDFSWIIIINLSIALFVSFFFVPALVIQMSYHRRKKYKDIHSSIWIISWADFYRKYIVFTQKRKWIYYILLILAFGIPFHAIPSSIGNNDNYYMQEREPKLYEIVYKKTFGSDLFQYELKGFFSYIFGGTMRLFATSIDDNTYSDKERDIVLNIRAQMPLGGKAYELNEKVVMLENFLTGFNEIERFVTSINGGGATITVEFKDEYKDTSFPYILENKVIGQLLNIGGTDWSTFGVSQRGFSNSLNLQHRSNRIEIAGYNYSKLYYYAEEISKELHRNSRVTDIIIEIPDHESNEDEIFVDYNKKNIALYDVNISDVHSLLGELLEERNFGNYNNNGVNTQLKLQSKRSEAFDLWTMQNSYLDVDGRSIYLPTIMTIDKRKAKDCISKKNQEYILSVSFNVIGSYTYISRYIKSVTEHFNKVFPVGYRCINRTYGWYNDNGTQYWLLLVIVVIIFFVCSILFESLRLPLVIISLIPVSFIGTFLTFYFTKIDFGTGGFASLVLLCGIVVNAGIYIVNEYNILLGKRKDSDESVNVINIYVKAYNHKIVPVLLTIVSTVLGLVPFLIDGMEERFWFSFAVGTIGGLLFSLIALVFIMPIFMNFKTTKTK